ncbi:MAG TPA: ammonium transporter, partial [Gemmatimonadales bacterium]
LMTRGALDFAGGTVVHINAGVSALVAALVLGSRKDYGRTAVLPHNVPFVLLGAGLLWFGWFGFNGGSALAANELAGLAFTNTFLAPAATLVVWTLLDYFRTGKATAVGGATGIVVGLVAITPAAGFVSPMSAIVLGAVAAFPSYFMIQLRSRTRIDDSLDVFAGHGIGGLTGALLTGVLAQKVWNTAGNDGLLFGNPHQLAVQALACLSAAAYAGIMTFVILKVLGLVMSLRAVPRIEGVGMDVSQHGEEAYASGEGSILVPPEAALVPGPLPAFTPQVASR